MQREVFALMGLPFKNRHKGNNRGQCRMPLGFYPFWIFVSPGRLLYRVQHPEGAAKSSRCKSHCSFAVGLLCLLLSNQSQQSWARYLEAHLISKSSKRSGNICSTSVQSHGLSLVHPQVVRHDVPYAPPPMHIAFGLSAGASDVLLGITTCPARRGHNNQYLGLAQVPLVEKVPSKAW